MSRNWGELVAKLGFVKGFWANLTNFKPANLLKQVNPCFDVKMLLENSFDLADASP